MGMCMEPLACSIGTEDMAVPARGSDKLADG